MGNPYYLQTPSFSLSFQESRSSYPSSIQTIRSKPLTSLQPVNASIDIILHIEIRRCPILRQIKILPYPRQILLPLFRTILVPRQFTMLNILIRVSETSRILHRPVLQFVPRATHTHLADAGLHGAGGAGVAGRVVGETHEILTDGVDAVVYVVEGGGLGFPAAVLEEGTADVFLEGGELDLCCL